MTSPPETRYARSGDVSVAYQVTGEGPFDVVYVPPFISNVELAWEVPEMASFYERLSSFCRLIRFDKRGQGMSDRVSGVPTLETRMDDVRAVMDAVGSVRAALIGISEGTPMSILFAATYPERVWALALCGSFARARWAPDYPMGIRDEEIRLEDEDTEKWGSAEHSTAIGRALLPDGSEHAPYAGATQAYTDAIRDFFIAAWEHGAGEEEEHDRVLATILFTDIVGSTAKAAELGDRRWHELLKEHHALVRRQLLRYRGTELDTAGDGIFASFDGPARAIRCARAITTGVDELGIQVRAGVHTGECERMNGKVGGIAVHIGARVAAEAGPGEVVVSGTVKDLVAGSGIEFRDRGAAELKGVPGEWRLFAVEAA